MRGYGTLPLAVTLLVISSVSVQAINLNSNAVWDPLEFVDPLIGSQNGGATIPYGMAKPSPDTDDQSNQGGFTFTKSSVTGFSQMHDSGTGGNPSLGNFPLFVHPSCIEDDINRCKWSKTTRKTPFDEQSVVAEPGYFSIRLQNNVTAEMTATRRTSIFKFGIPASKKHPVLLLDLSDLSNSRRDNGTITVDPETGRMTGGAPFEASFGGGTYKAYFCADFQGAEISETGIFVNSRASSDVKTLTISRSINGYPLPGGAFLRFKPGTTSVTARVGVSLISAKQACQTAEQEIPDFNFKPVKYAAQKLWRDKLSAFRIDTSGVDKKFAKIFYSGIYRTMISPQDYTGENPLWKSNEPYFDSFYCIWDSFRTHFPMLVLTDPPAMTKMIRTLLDVYKHDGWLPDCRMSLSRGYTQGGSNADVVLTDAFVKGVRNDINWQQAYKAVVKDAEEQPFDWSSGGRGGVESWISHGYIPAEDFSFTGFGPMTRSISRTLEYSYNDFAIAQLARALGKTADTAKYLSRSRNWLNLFNPATVSFITKQEPAIDTGFKGFFQPRYANGTWGFQDPLRCTQLHVSTVGECSLQITGGEMYESSIWEYGFYVPQDGATLVKTLGGPSEFVRRLEFLHDKGISYIGNEPSFLSVFQYHYAGRPGLSAKRSHAFIPSQFTAEKDGLPGNDDSGTMGAFASFNMLGLFPIAGQDVYLIIPPYFASVDFTSPVSNKTASISIANFDPTYKAIYIQSATLNGKPYTKNWLTHDFFVSGAQLVLTVGERESAWGTRVEDLPPSMGEYAPMPPFVPGGPLPAQAAPSVVPGPKRVVAPLGDGSAVMPTLWQAVFST